MAQRARYQPPGARPGKRAGVRMAIKTFKAKIALDSFRSQEITVQADNAVKAKELIKLQYGNAKIVSGPHEVRR